MRPRNVAFVVLAAIPTWVAVGSAASGNWFIAVNSVLALVVIAALAMEDRGPVVPEAPEQPAQPYRDRFEALLREAAQKDAA